MAKKAISIIKWRNQANGNHGKQAKMKTAKIINIGGTRRSDGNSRWRRQRNIARARRRHQQVRARQRMASGGA